MDASHPALDEFRNWSVETHEKLSTEYAILLEQRDQLAAAAREQLEQGKFSAAQKYIGQIPEPLHTDDIQSLVDEATAKSDEVKQLGAVIQSAIKTRSYDGLLSQVEHYLTLKPGDATAQKLRDRLQKREQKQQDREAAVATEEEFPEHDSYEDDYDDSYDAPRTVRSSRRSRSSRKRAGNQKVMIVGGSVIAGLLLIAAFVFYGGDDSPEVGQLAANNSRSDTAAASGGDSPGNLVSDDATSEIASGPSEATTAPTRDITPVSTPDEPAAIPATTAATLPDPASIFPATSVPEADSSSAAISLTDSADWDDWRCRQQGGLAAGDAGGWQLDGSGVLSDDWSAGLREPLYSPRIH